MKYVPVSNQFGHPRGSLVFSKFRGLQNYFSEHFRFSLIYHESENFSDSSLRHIFEFEYFRFPFLYENSLTWAAKCEK